MENEKKKGTHGGRRAGAGRKPILEGRLGVRVNFMLSEKAAANLLAAAEKAGCSRNHILNTILEELSV